MQTHHMPAWVAPALAFNFVFVVLHAMTGIMSDHPQAIQWDLWRLCLLFLAILSFTFLTAEYGLAKLSNALPLQAYAQLTRDADVSTKWRILAWAGIWNLLVVAGAIVLWTAGLTLMMLPDAWFQSLSTDGEYGVFVSGSLIIGVSALALSFTPRKIMALIGVIAELIIVALAVMDDVNTYLPTSTRIIPALLFAFISSGCSIGLYWQNWLNTKSTMIKSVIPTIAAQLLAVIVVLPSGLNDQNTWQMAMAALSSAALGAVLLNMAREQLQSRFSPSLSAIACILPLAILAFCAFFIRKSGSEAEFWIFWTVMIPILLATSVIFILYPLLFSIFVGWKIKTESLHEAMQFSNTISYRIWLTSFRLIMPLVIIILIFDIIKMP